MKILKDPDAIVRDSIGLKLPKSIWGRIFNRNRIFDTETKSTMEQNIRKKS